jgi:hypothetical protein
MLKSFGAILRDDRREHGPLNVRVKIRILGVKNMRKVTPSEIRNN